MSKTEIIAELPRLSPDERAEVQAKLDELAADAWQGDLSESDKAALDTALSEYEKDPSAGSTWEDVKARVQAQLNLKRG